MSDEKYVYVVFGESGEYSDYSAWVEAIYTDKTVADKERARLNEEMSDDIYLEYRYSVQKWRLDDPTWRGDEEEGDDEPEVRSYEPCL